MLSGSIFDWLRNMLRKLANCWWSAKKHLCQLLLFIFSTAKSEGMNDVLDVISDREYLLGEVHERIAQQGIILTSQVSNYKTSSCQNHKTLYICQNLIRPLDNKGIFWSIDGKKHNLKKSLIKINWKAY